MDDLQAKADGLEVLDISEAASRGDVVMVLLPDEKHGEVYREQIADGIAPGNTLLFGHGFSVHYGEVDPPPEVATVGALQAWLGLRHPRFAEAAAARGVVRCAVNQEYADADTPVRPGDEVAFFPPVTGG